MKSSTIQENQLAGILLMTAAGFMFSSLDASAKYLTASFPLLQIIWMRFTVHFFLSILFLNPLTSKDSWQLKRPFLQILRAMFLLGATTSNFLAIQYLQLTQTISIFFSAPFIIALLAIPILGERIGIRRWVSILVGFCGVLLVARPGADGFHFAMLFSIASAFCYSGYSLTTRFIAHTVSSGSMLIFSAGIAALALTPFVWPILTWPTEPLQWLLLLAMGIFGSFGHYLLINAHRLAPAPVLAPFLYSQIIWMLLLGFFIFGEFPDHWTIAGAIVIIGSGVYLLNREGKARQKTIPEQSSL